MEVYANGIPDTKIAHWVVDAISAVYGTPKIEIEMDADFRKDYNWDDVDIVDFLDLAEEKTGVVVKLDQSHLKDPRLATVGSTIELFQSAYDGQELKAEEMTVVLS
jgi:acyl carrier protein